MGLFYDHILSDFCPGLYRILEGKKGLRILAKAGGYAMLVFLALIAVYGYQTLDRAGYVPHHRDTPVWIAGEWMAGEYRLCDMPVKTTRLFCGKDVAGGSIPEFAASVSEADSDKAFQAGMTRNSRTDWTPLAKYFHVLPVHFNGRLERPERDRDRQILSWRCQRESDSLTCNALD